MTPTDTLHLHAERIVKPRNSRDDHYPHMQFLGAREIPVGWCTEESIPPPCDKRDKYSEGYIPCTGIVFMGDSKTDGLPISTLSHHTPKVVKNYTECEVIIETVARDLLSKAIRETIEIGIIGGKIYPNTNPNSISTITYITVITNITNLIRKHLDITPLILSGPILSPPGASTNAYLRTAQKKLYICTHGSQPSFMPVPFPADEIISRIKEFQERLTSVPGNGFTGSK